jgi:hypothetical protein
LLTDFSSQFGNQLSTAIKNSLSDFQNSTTSFIAQLHSAINGEIKLKTVFEENSRLNILTKAARRNPKPVNLLAKDITLFLIFEIVESILRPILAISDSISSVRLFAITEVSNSL